MRQLLPTLLLVSLQLLIGNAALADWPTFRHDNRRSGYTEESIGGVSVEEVWVWRSSQPPQPAWPGPARWDSYANIRGLGSMRNYDPCFHVVVAADRVYFGSSTDDSVRAVNATTGAVEWTFTTDGPVRIAPSVTGEHVYFSSDDGCAYCVTATKGTLVWKSNREDDEDFILNNGRFVSLSPCRTGVLVDGDVAYFGQGMLPWRNSVLHAVDRLTGRADRAGQFASSHFGLTMEGALLTDGTRLIAPAGRVAPEVFRRSDGHHEGSLEGSGGSSVVLTGDGHVLCGPGNKTGWVTETDLSSRKQIDVHSGQLASAITPHGRVMISRTRLTAYDLSGQTKRWDLPTRHDHEVIVAGKTVLVGGDDVVAAHALADGHLLWEIPVDGAACGLAVTNGRLYVSTDTGTIHCFRASAVQPSQLFAATHPNPAAAPASVHAPDDDQQGLLGHWVIHRDMARIARRRGIADGDRRVSDLTGNAHAAISGEIRIREVGGVEALELDGETNTLLITDDIASAPLPKQTMSVETWVRVDEADSAGGIIGCVQDTKEEKSGWILGFHHSRFVFGIAAEGGTDGITFVRGQTEVRPGHWYHVVATYDGTVARLIVNGRSEAESIEQTGPMKYPDTGWYEMGASHDADSFHPMYGMLHEVRVYDRVVTDAEVTRRYDASHDNFNVPIELETGPYAQFLTPDSARIRWHTAAPMPTRLVVREQNGDRRFGSAELTTIHEVTADRLPRDRMLHYLIEESGTKGNAQSLEFELDTHFNFSSATIPSAAQPFPDDERSEQFAAAARRILDACEFDRGICLVIGSGEGRLAWELVKQSDLRIIGVETDDHKVAAARDALRQAGVYGARVSIHAVDDYSDLPFVGRFANLVVSEQPQLDGETPLDANEVFRVLRPHGGRVCFGQPAESDVPFDGEEFQAWLSITGLTPQLVTGDDGTWVSAARPPLEGSGQWTHLYGRADNSAFGGESLGGASTTSEMDVQWIGRPGPRAQPDRNGRKPSPLSTGGRLFVQGLHRIIALDSFNGTVLWALEIPALERFNMPRDCSNWCADEDFIYIAAKDKCWQLDAATGGVLAFHPVTPGDRSDWSWDWGFIAQVDDRIIGSAEKSESAFRSFWGDAGAGWYDARTGPATFKVCSDSIFALHKSDGSVDWTYENGIVINSTITVADGRIYFVECRHAGVKESSARRVGSDELWEEQFLVALDVNSGQVIWEQPIDTANGTVAFYLAAGDDTLVINASTNNRFEVSTWAAADGAGRWKQTFDWFEKKGDHGKAIQRPAIVGGRVYVRPKILDLLTGEILPMEMPSGKCGTYAATTQSLIFRTTQITMWDTFSGSASSWERMRPGCWLSTIPANGMLLSPEGGGGCSCGSWMEMSVGFMPKATARQP